MTGYFYILTNRNNNVLYSGVTSDLIDRIKKHEEKKYAKSFTSKYNVDKLVYFEKFDSVVEAIKREKQIKGGSRKKKIDIVESVNPAWVDLSDVLDGA